MTRLAGEGGGAHIAPCGGNGEAVTINGDSTRAGRVSHAQERRAYAEFASRHGEQDYRAPLAVLYDCWRGLNRDHFGGRMLAPHLALGRTAPRSLGHFARSTGYGGQGQMSLNAGLVFGTNPAWVVHPWPAEGARRFLEDLLLRLSVRQFVAEVLGVDEPGYHGFGPQFVREANRVGQALGLGPVAARRRGPQDRRAVATGWPHCVRPAGYYVEDVTAEALALATACGEAPAEVETPGRALLEWVVYLVGAGRGGEVGPLAARHLAWVEEATTGRWPRRPTVEAGVRDTDGSPLGPVAFDPAWLAWQGGLVRRMAVGILRLGCFVDLPLLGDALGQAGCTEGRILRHLRERVGHGRRCWVLRGLLGGQGKGS